MKRIWLFGRELDLPETAVTVRAHDGATVLSDGPRPETEAVLPEFDVIECASLELALGSMNGAAIAAAKPYLLSVWLGAGPGVRSDARGLAGAFAGWRENLDRDRRLVMASILGGVETAATLRVSAEASQLGDGPFIDVNGAIVCIDVVLASDRQQAIAVAATHPLASSFGVEVRPFLTV